MSASAMLDALVTVLSAASCFGASMVGKSTYDVLDRASGSCAVVSPGSYKSVVDTMGLSTTDQLDISLEMWVKDNGDVSTFHARVVRMIDTTASTLRSNLHLLGTGEIYEFNASYQSGRALEHGGNIWVPFPATITTKEYS